jgi:hypothetical protein
VDHGGIFFCCKLIIHNRASMYPTPHLEIVIRRF